jgi:hypothetical protein
MLIVRGSRTAMHDLRRGGSAIRCIVRPLRIGDHLMVWPSNGASNFMGAPRPVHFEGALIDFLPGRREARAALVKLTAPGEIAAAERFLVLELSHAGACWAPVGTVDAVLHEARPRAGQLEPADHGGNLASQFHYELVVEPRKPLRLHLPFRRFRRRR